MSAKIISSYKDENPNLQKQIGCMNGIFQQFLAGRRLSSHNNKKLLPESHLQERIEKHRTSTESSRTSTSSSFSSFDHHPTDQPERTPTSGHTYAETPSQTVPIKQHICPPVQGRQTLDIRDVVKDAMYREARGISIKTVAKEEGRSCVMKHIDSPRPLQNQKSGQPRVTGLNGSIRATTKHQEAPPISQGEKDVLFQQRLKEPRRFSYDGREWRDAAKSSIKLKELPRLSLDSRDTRTPACELRSNPLQEPSSNTRSGVIAKLMGLETFPERVSTCQSKTIIPDEDSTSTLSHIESRQNQVPLSPRVLRKDPASPRPSKSQISSSRFPIEHSPQRQQDTSKESRNVSVKDKEVPGSAPHACYTIYGEIEKRITDLEFKRSGKDLRALKQILEAMQKTRQRLENQEPEEVDLESQTSRFSSYSQDSKPLTRQNQQNNHLSPSIQGTSLPKRPDSSIVIMKPVKLVDKFSSPPVTAADSSHLQKRRTQDTSRHRLASVDKQISLDQRPVKSNPHEPSWRFPSVEKKKDGRTSKAVQISREPKHVTGEYFTAPAKSSGTMSPISQKKHEIDKQNRPNALSSDLRRARMHSNKMHTDSTSPDRKLKHKSAHLQRGDNRKSKEYSEMRDCFHQDDITSLLSEGNNILASHVTSTDCSENESNQRWDCKDRDPALRLSEDMPIAELAMTIMEQPSPVSVLDATFYREDSPSPEKKISTAFTNEGSVDADEADWSPEYLDNSQKIRKPSLALEFNNKKLENIKDLVHKLKLLNPAPDEATTDNNVSISDSHNRDHRYITKILLASGLLKDVSLISIPIQLHPSGHVINPKLFHVLEQTERQTQLVGEEVNGKPIQLKSNQKIQRKIVFDTVNEILVHKLSSENTFLLGRRTWRGQELLKQLYSEVDHLQNISNSGQDFEDDQLVSILNSDMKHQLADWTGYHCEMPAVVLDIERLIFKDLISEVIHEEIAHHQNWKRHCRQLFT